MQALGQQRKISTSPAATITTRLPDGAQRVRTLTEGESLAVGSSEAADLRLEAEDVAPTHCILGVRDGVVWVRDCYSRAGTLVDGQRVSEAQLRQNSEIRLGSCRLYIEVAHRAALPKQQPLDPRGQATVPAREVPNAPPVGVQDRDPGPSATDTVIASLLHRDHGADADVRCLHQELQQSQQEISRLRKELERLRSQRAASPSAGVRLQADPFQAEMLEMLRAENAQLQAELADRDAQLAELGAWGEQSEGERDADVGESPGDSETLVKRLEQLLDELQRKEEDETLLEEMLRAVEEANRAEQEERRQLEAWVNDIEERIALREAESQATVEKLQRQVVELAAERDQAEQALQETHSGREAAELLERLRQQIANLQGQLEDSQRQRAELEGRVDNAVPNEEALRHQVDQLLREQRLEIARERAELARQRAELELVQQRAQATRRPTDSDDRIRVLRQHLQQLQQEETDHRKQQSLSAKVARLWRRLEGRGG